MKKLKYFLLFLFVSVSFYGYSQNEITIQCGGSTKWNTATDENYDLKIDGVELKVKYIPSVPCLNFYLYSDYGIDLDDLFGVRKGYGTYYYNYDNSHIDDLGAVFWEIILYSNDNNDFVRLTLPDKYNKYGFVYFGRMDSDVETYASIPAKDTERLHKFVVNAVQKLGLPKTQKSIPIQIY